MISYKEFIGKSLSEKEDSESIYAVPDKAKAIAMLNQAIGQLPGIVSTLKDMSQKFESSGLNSSKIKSTAESLEKYIETLKSEVSA